MIDTIRIAVDVMGGDLGPRATLPAALASLQQFPELELVLVGDPAVLREVAVSPRVAHLAADQVVEMSDKPSRALRSKTASSMRRAIDLLAAGEVDAVVSAGNTGALVAMATTVVETLPGIDRPAFCSPLPARDGPCYLLDLGANLDCSAAQLHQFAMMGSALAGVMDGIVSPRVALLNIGAEEIKGTEAIRTAAAAIAADGRLNYVGYIEGGQLFSGAADVVVCDGFAGNVALKACEGTAQFIAAKLRERFSSGVLPRLLGWFVKPVLRGLYAELDPHRYNGASLLGLRGVVVKSHGDSTAETFQRAIACAVTAVQHDLPGRIAQQLKQGVAGDARG